MIVIIFVLRFCNTVCTYSHANKACCCFRTFREDRLSRDAMLGTRVFSTQLVINYKIELLMLISIECDIYRFLHLKSRPACIYKLLC